MSPLSTTVPQRRVGAVLLLLLALVLAIAEAHEEGFRTWRDRWRGRRR
jgi:hypothetical protein